MHARRRRAAAGRARARESSRGVVHVESCGRRERERRARRRRQRRSRRGDARADRAGRYGVDRERDGEDRLGQAAP